MQVHVKGSEDLLRQSPLMSLRDILEAMELSSDLVDAPGLIEIASRLAEVAAFDVACSITEAQVVDLLDLSAQLETQANRVRHFLV